MPPAILAGAALAVAAVGTTAQIKSSMDAESAAEDAADQQKKDNDAALTAQKTSDENNAAQRSSQANASAQLARSRRLKAGSGSGRAGTILGNPIVANSMPDSTIGGTSMASKSLLGS